MASRLKTDGRLGHGFKRLVQKRLARADRHLALADDDLETAVHEARKEFKAVRSLARMIRHLVPKEDYKDINGAVRDAARGISALRDAHAMNDAIDLLTAESGLRTEARKPLRRAAARAAAPAEATGKRSVGHVIEDARALIAPLPRRVAGLDLPNSDVSAYVEGLATSYAEARDALAEGFASQDAEALHEGRKRVINWRYQLDTVSPIWRSVMKAEVRELQALREHLGNHNDIVMLQRALESNEKPWSRLAAREEWIERAKKVRPHIVERAEALAALLFAEPPKRRAKRLEALWKASRRG